jgi:hypothetical protein
MNDEVDRRKLWNARECCMLFHPTLDALQRKPE